MACHAALAALVTTLSAPAAAAIVAMNTSSNAANAAGLPASAEQAVWTYALSLWPGETLLQPVQSGTGTQAVPSSGMANHMLVRGARFSLQGFAGYVDGSCSAPTGWVCEVQLSDLSATARNPAGEAHTMSLVDLVWIYSDGPRLAGQRGGLDLGLFSAASVQLGSSTLAWTGLGGPTGMGSGASPWTLQQGALAGPGANALSMAVPTPSSLALVGMALGLLGVPSLVRRPRRR